MNETTNTHSKLITMAAKSVLGPIGTVQKGRSRTWLGDHGWWLDVVEFQPSDWTKGAYLNVSCTWLWHVKNYISFDEGKVREMPLQRFHYEQQFADVAGVLARTAKERVLHYRSLFNSIRAVSDFYLDAEEAPVGWRAFNAAVAHGICGRTDAALDLFLAFASTLNTSVEWSRKASEDTKELMSVVRDPNQFRRLIGERVAHTRELQKLSAVEIDFGTSSSGHDELLLAVPSKRLGYPDILGC